MSGPLNHEESTAALRRLGALGAMKMLPAARLKTPREQDRDGAVKILAQAILDSIARCEALERAQPPPARTATPAGWVEETGDMK